MLEGRILNVCLFLCWLLRLIALFLRVATRNNRAHEYDSTQQTMSLATWHQRSASITRHSPPQMLENALEIS